MPANKYAAIRYKIIHSMLSKKYPDYPSKEDLRQACEDVLYGSLGENISISRFTRFQLGETVPQSESVDS